MGKTGRAKTGSIEHAIEVFLRGFTFVRSVTHPYLAERVGGVWVMRDEERRTGEYRNEEWVVYGVKPNDADEVARKHTRGRFELSVIHEVRKPDEDLRSGYRDLGYRLGTTEPLMVHRLKGSHSGAHPLQPDEAKALRACVGRPSCGSHRCCRPSERVRAH